MNPIKPKTGKVLLQPLPRLMNSNSKLAVKLVKKGREWDTRGRDRFFDSYGLREGTMLFSRGVMI